jgi:hypothetical protein
MVGAGRGLGDGSCAERAPENEDREQRATVSGLHGFVFVWKAFQYEDRSRGRTSSLR